MRKIIFILIMMLGFGFISLGIFFQVNDSSTSKDKTRNEKETEKLEEKNDEIPRINKFSLEETCRTFNTTTTYINTSNFSKITLTYPNCVHEYTLSYWSKILVSEDDSIHLDATIERETITNFMNEKKTSIIALKNDSEYDVEYSEITKIKNKDDKNVSILETNYKNIYGYKYNVLYIAVELEKELLLTFEIRTKENVISNQVIYELINNVKIEEDAAIFNDVKTEGNYHVGSIKSNFNKSYEHGYKINYKAPKEYPIVPAFTSNHDSVVFEYEDLYKSLYVNMSIENASYLDTMTAEINQSNDISIKTYKEDTNRYRNFKTTGIIEKEINNKKVFYYIYTYDYYFEDKKMNDGYFATVLYELRPQMYVKLYMTTKDIVLDENLISEYLNFTVEEY